jgi:hypothetical protein
LNPSKDSYKAHSSSILCSWKIHKDHPFIHLLWEVDASGNIEELQDEVIWIIEDLVEAYDIWIVWNETVQNIDAVNSVMIRMSASEKLWFLLLCPQILSALLAKELSDQWWNELDSNSPYLKKLLSNKKSDAADLQLAKAIENWAIEWLTDLKSNFHANLDYMLLNDQSWVFNPEIVNRNS